MMVVAGKYHFVFAGLGKVQDDKNILKLMYIGGMSFFGGYASITYIFLIIYENIVAYSAWGGN